MKPLPIHKPITIISGGQTGADRAGLDAAYKLRVPTTGYVPKGFRTESGNDFKLKRYNVVEHKSKEYAPRTFDNAKASDVTIIISPEKNSKGTLLTLDACVQYDKPHIIIDDFDGKNVDKLLAFLSFFPHNVINIAGNRESVAPGLHVNAGRFLVKAFSRLLNDKGWLSYSSNGNVGRYTPPSQCDRIG
jgi:hypothetical protein